MENNQCDGCKAGLPLNERGNHIDTGPGGNFGCTKDRYNQKKQNQHLPEILNALNKAGYIDDDIRCEDNTDVIREYNQIIAKYQLQSTKASKVYQLLIKRNYIQDNFEEAFGFIRGYFYFIGQANGK